MQKAYGDNRINVMAIYGVADIGSGRGKFSFKLAEAVGEDGKVYCRDIRRGSIETIKRMAEFQGISNIDAQVSQKDDVLLPQESIDVALLSDVYHFVVRQQTTDGFLESLYESMKLGEWLL